MQAITQMRMVVKCSLFYDSQEAQENQEVTMDNK